MLLGTVDRLTCFLYVFTGLFLCLKCGKSSLYKILNEKNMFFDRQV